MPSASSSSSFFFSAGWHDDRPGPGVVDRQHVQQPGNHREEPGQLEIAVQLAVQVVGGGLVE